jgi:ParB-like nuclease domain
MNTQISIRNILPNPFRRIEHYKLKEEKISALQESFNATGIWPIIIGRWQNGTGGKVEIAYGHHRLEAARRTYGPDGEIGVIVKDLSDEQMLKMMANENLEEWGAGSEFSVTIETVCATVEAYGADRIALPPVHRDTKTATLRFAPSFRRGAALKGLSHSYSSTTLAHFLGWDSPGSRSNALAALSALEYMEIGILRPVQLAGLSSAQVKAVVQEIRIAEKRSKDALEGEDLSDLPTKVGAAVSTAFKHGKAGVQEARKITDAVTEGKTPKSLPLSNKFITRLCVDISNLIDPEFDKRRARKLQCVIDSKAYLSAEDVIRVAVVLTDLAERCRVLANALRPERRERALTSHRIAVLPSA